jgi:hypothetical protein
MPSQWRIIEKPLAVQGREQNFLFSNVFNMKNNHSEFSAKHAARHAAKKAAARIKLENTPKGQRAWNQDPTDYNYLLDANQLEFAWQFLRRNSAYRDASKAAYDAKVEADNAATEFGVKEFIDHRSEQLEAHQYSLLSVRPIARNIKKQEFTRTLEFDLRLDIATQLENARLFLEQSRSGAVIRDHRKAVTPKPTFTKLDVLKKIHLLRLLDGAEFFSQKALARYLVDSYEQSYGSKGLGKKGSRKGRMASDGLTEDIVAQHLKEARALSTFGYLDLILDWTRQEAREFYLADELFNITERSQAESISWAE